MARGIRRDSSLANQRRLALVRRLLRGPATSAELVADLRLALGDDIYPADASAALRHDLVALRQTFACEFFFRTGEGYFLTDVGMLTLLDVAQDEREACALIFNAIDEGVLPHTPALLRFRDHLRKLMPIEQRATLVAQPATMRLLAPKQLTKADASLVKRIQPMLGRNEVSFEYRSPYTPADSTEKHRVAPYAFEHRDGATYLEAYCLESSIPKLRGRTIYYRLDRIVSRSLRRLPQVLPPMRYTQRVYRLRYWLAPHVARRRDVTQWFEESTCDYAEDGSAIIEACIHDLWQAQTILLRYRERCRVIEPPELVEMMRTSVEHMLRLYMTPTSDSDHEEMKP